MSARTDRSSLPARRAELLAEVFFEELKPEFVARPPTPDVGYDLLVGFRNEKSGINTFAVEVKSTEEPVGPRFPLPRTTFDRLAHSNVPAILLVVDVKRNQLYYAWLLANGEKRGTPTVSVPLTELTDATKPVLLRRLQSANGAVAAAG
jgi:hypothetical protein